MKLCPTCGRWHGPRRVRDAPDGGVHLGFAEVVAGTELAGPDAICVDAAPPAAGERGGTGVLALQVAAGVGAAAAVGEGRAWLWAFGALSAGIQAAAAVGMGRALTARRQLRAARGRSLPAAKARKPGTTNLPSREVAQTSCAGGRSLPRAGAGAQAARRRRDDAPGARGTRWGLAELVDAAAHLQRTMRARGDGSPGHRQLLLGLLLPLDRQCLASTCPIRLGLPVRLSYGACDRTGGACSRATSRPSCAIGEAAVLVLPLHPARRGETM
mmetsp:Transcript_78527/g.234036  ORF Transcript_78527/g.234036 Transcript_78527/m.234036 type:complete len:271 (-) Transcript_78527:839-1651(-)